MPEIFLLFSVKKIQIKNPETLSAYYPSNNAAISSFADRSL